MAPSSSPLLHCAERQLTQQPRKLRKPVIEKMRRDRINSSIEQLRLLLEKEFRIQKHQLPSKPEKADILEMTVTFLQQHMAEKYVTSSQAHRDGYSTCVQDSVSFLSLQKQTGAQLQLLQNLHEAQNVPGALYPSAFPVSQIPSKHSSRDSGKSLWRPW